MQNDRHVMDNGDVYEIQQDGTIHKIGNINNTSKPKREEVKESNWRDSRLLDILFIPILLLCWPFIVIKVILEDLPEWLIFLLVVGAGFAIWWFWWDDIVLLWDDIVDFFEGLF